MFTGTQELSTICELIAVASLCSWIVSITVGLGFFAADRALLTGVPGTLLGDLLSEHAGWPAGVEIGGYPLVPALLGTMIVIALAAYGKRIAADLEERKDLTPARPVRDWPDPERARP